MDENLVSREKSVPWWQVASHVVLAWWQEALATLRARRQSDRRLAINLALAKVRRRQAIVSLVRARQEVFFGMVGGHRLCGRGRVRKLNSSKTDSKV